MWPVRVFYFCIWYSCLDDKEYSLTNFVEVADYFGANEDVAMFKFQPAVYDEIHSMIEKQIMIEIPINGVISEISIINEHQELFENDTQIYDVYVTRGIIFKFEDGHELSFEKEIFIMRAIWWGYFWRLRKIYYYLHIA